MLKRIINVFISILIVFFSFFYTNKIIKIFKNNDPIMLEIKKYSNNNNKNIDIEKSYNKMKKTGLFDEKLLVFNNNSIDSNRNDVFLIIKLKNTYYLDQILDILKDKNVNATFFIDKSLFSNSRNLLKEIINNGNDVELLSDNYSIYEVNKISSILKTFSKDKLNFCLNNNNNSKIPKACESSKLILITPDIKNTNNLYLEIKNKLKKELIIEIDNNKHSIMELSSSINYILQKGMKISLLKNINFE